MFTALPDSATAQRIAARDTVYARARRRLIDSVGPQLRGYPGRVGRARTDSTTAVLLSRRVYAERLDRFDSVYAATGGDIREAIRRVIATHKDSVKTSGRR
ncbi:hypothetical protein [Gemmatimonas sp.]|uniref:hypothetical protein n=1 Tax=Gemmatimonas sp. TaxID=1962908 RepID=UPI003DA5E57F